MKSFLIFLSIFVISFLVLATSIAYASLPMEPFAVATKLQSSDASRLYQALSKLGKKVEKDKGDPERILHKVAFTSADGALNISCTKKIKIIDVGTDCEVVVDSALSSPGNATAVMKGVMSGVIVIHIMAKKDVNLLKRTLAKPLGYFQSEETVQVKLPNSSLGKAARLKMDCKSVAQVCQLTLFP